MVIIFAVLRLSRLSVPFADRLMVGHMDLTVEPGQTVGLIGGSGSGKTLTALAVPGLLPDTAQADGRITLDGVDAALSGGQRQRVAVARALAPQPEVLVADEPVSALDATIRVKVLDLLRDAGERTGAALVMVSHDVAAVRRICNRAAVLHQGRIAESGSVADVLTQPGGQATRDLLAAVPRLPAPAA
jgi:ABC-type glutathione transport system ATPase component